MTSKRSVYCAAAALVAVTLAAPACSQEPQAGSFPATSEQARTGHTATPRSSAAPQTDVHPPTGSAPATATTSPSKHLSQQLHRTTEHFFATVNTALKTLDPAPIKDLSTNDCNACKRYIHTINNVEADGHRYVNDGSYTIERFRVVNNTTSIDERRSASFVLGHPDIEEVDANGKHVRTVSLPEQEQTLTFRRQGDRWLVQRQF